MTNQVTQQTFAKHLTSLVRSQTSIKAKAHALIVFAISHAFLHGDTVYLNMLKDKLAPAYLASFRRYLVAVTAVDYNSPVTSWLSMVKGQYIMNPDFKGKKRQIFFRDKNKTEKLRKPEELLSRPTFMDIDPDKVKNPYADDNVFSAMKRVTNSMNKDDSKVSKEVKKIIEHTNVRLAKLTNKAESGSVQVAL